MDEKHMQYKETSQLCMEDLTENPKLFGLPTFEEFCRNPDQWRSAAERAFEQLDAGSTAMKNQIDKHVYYVSGYKCSSLELAQRILRDEYGIESATEIAKLGTRIELEDVAMGKIIAHIYLDPKMEPKNAPKPTS